jgi:4-diphosphocytidyl-2-C-methyl-D-erythritol kinase
VSALSVFAPAKINLFLAVTGQRADGFHDLVSVVVPLEFGDTLTVEARGEGRGTTGEFSLECDDATVPVDENNLVLNAAKQFAAVTGWDGGAKFKLAKRIPMGAGLGGGSSDGAAALQALNQIAGIPLAPAALAEVAARVGSDCPLFLPGGPVAMRGRGERIEPLPAGAAARLRGRRVIVFKPDFGIATPWAYARLAAEKVSSYLPAAVAEARLAAWLSDSSAPAEALLFNNMERAAFAKFVALPTLLDELRVRFGLATRMSGSGSACFGLPHDDVSFEEIAAAIRAAWGASALVVETRIA